MFKKTYTLADGRQPTAEYVNKPFDFNELIGKTLACPGCTADDIAMQRCHTSILSDHIGADTNIVGMQGLTHEYLSEIMHTKDVVFVGRRPPRGMKKAWPDKKCQRSRFCNPFIIKKGGFSLGESLALFKSYIENDMSVASSDTVNCVISTAKSMKSDKEILQDVLDFSKNTVEHH